MPRAIVKAKGGVWTQGGVLAPFGAEVEITPWEAEHLPGWYEVLVELRAPVTTVPATIDRVEISAEVKPAEVSDALARLRRKPPPPPPRT